LEASTKTHKAGKLGVEEHDLAVTASATNNRFATDWDCKIKPPSHSDDVESYYTTKSKFSPKDGDSDEFLGVGDGSTHFLLHFLLLKNGTRLKLGLPQEEARWLLTDSATNHSTGIGEAIDWLAPKKRRPDVGPNKGCSGEASFDPILPDLNDDSIPTPISKRTNKKDGSLNTSSLTDTVASYTEQKTQLLLQKDEHKRKRDEEEREMRSLQKQEFLEKKGATRH
jgi:hypothetical protein